VTRSRLHARFPGLTLGHLALGHGPTPVRRLDGLGVPELDGVDLWLKDESRFGDGAWGGNKVRKLEWIIPEARRRGVRTLFTVGGIGTHWGLACALDGADHGLRTVLGLVDQPVDDHVRQQLTRLEASGAELHRHRTPNRLRLAAPAIVARSVLRDRRWPWYLPAGGSNEYGALAYVDTALEIADQVRAGELPEPATVVTAVGSGGTAAGLALGLRLAGLRSRVFGVVVNDAFPLTAEVVTGLANRTADLLRAAGADLDLAPLLPGDVTMRTDWLGATYGDPTPESQRAVADAAAFGMTLEPVYTGKALAAIRDGAGRAAVAEPILWIDTHGPR
jgi:D-cysteine desulfhydrase